MITAFNPSAFQNNAFQIGGVPPIIETPSKGASGKRRKHRQAYEAQLAAQKANKEARKQALAELIDPPKAVVVARKEISEHSVKQAAPALNTAKLELGLQKLEVLAKMQELDAQHLAYRKMRDDDEDDAVTLMLLM